MAVVNEFQLINLVNLKPEVWDSNSVQFRNKVIKAAAWQEISASLGSTVDECQSMWKKLRDRYTRTKSMLPSGSEGGRKSWDKEEYMRFLDKVLVSRKTTSSAAAETSSCQLDNVEGIRINDAATTESVALDDSVCNLEIDEPNQGFDSVVLLDMTMEDDVTPDVPTASNAVDYEEASSSSSAVSTAPPVPAPAPPSKKIAAPIRQKGTKRKASSNANGNPEVAASLINAINKLSNAPEQQNIVPAAEPNINDEFIKYHSAQIKNLMNNKSETMQRRIRNRLSSFIDELYEELNE